VSLHRVSIAGVRTDIPARNVWKEAVAEIEAPPDLEDADFVKGRFLGLSAEQRHTFPSLRNLQLFIEGHSYRLVAIEESGAFIAVKEV
jgi:hypothetical protein